MKTFELVIAGGGLAAARAIKAYRESGGGGRIALLSEERTLPYHRPALSKKYLRGEKTDVPFVEDDAFYSAHDVELLLGEPATAVDVDNRRVTTRERTLHYDKLLIATGAAPRRLRAPGTELDGIFALRTVDDSEAIRAAAGSAERAAVVGGGFIGMETAASLRQLGLDVTLVHAGRGLFDQFGSAEVSDQLLGLYTERGVTVALEQEVTAFRGGRRLESLETKDGLRLDVDLAVVGVGVAPNVAFLDGSGIVVENGVVVDERLRTNVPGVHAAGDVANFFDPVSGRHRRIEHWSNANRQGAQAGTLLAGGDASFGDVSSFFSEVFGVTIKVFGDLSRFDDVRTEGDLESGLVATYGRGGRLVAALTVGQGDKVENRVKSLIRERAPARSLHESVMAA